MMWFSQKMFRKALHSKENISITVTLFNYSYRCRAFRIAGCGHLNIV